MYLDCEIKIPVVPGRINQIKKGKTTYIRYVLKRTYHADKKYNIPEQKVIGKRSETSLDLMIPNENFLKYFADVELPIVKKNSARSSCLRIGNYFVIKKIMEEYQLPEMLVKYLGKKETGLFLDLAAYSIVSENNASQYYPDYAYNHPLFTEKMHIYSDSKISDFFSGVTDDQRVGFLNEWNEKRDHREKIYISYDSTNKNCQAGELEMVEFGHPKDNRELPVFNYSIAYDTGNREPLFYEQYPGSIVDVSQLQYMLEKVKGYGYKRAGFILDRGYFSKENIQYMDECGYDFVVMVKGMASFVKALVLENKGRFVEFVALVIRSRIYTKLKDEEEKLEKRPNYMTVPAAIRELEKIEMIRQADGRYRLDHALTAVQKTILKAFQMDSNYIRKQSEELSRKLEENKKEEGLEEDTDGKTEEGTFD